MARIVIQTPVPAGTEVSYARAQAKIAAADQFPIQIVEETLLPAVPAPTDAAGSEHVPNDSSVDRVLTTVWDLIS